MYAKTIENSDNSFNNKLLTNNFVIKNEYDIFTTKRDEFIPANDEFMSVTTIKTIKIEQDKFPLKRLYK